MEYLINIVGLLFDLKHWWYFQEKNHDLSSINITIANRELKNAIECHLKLLNRLCNTKQNARSDIKKHSLKEKNTTAKKKLIRKLRMMLKFFNLSFCNKASRYYLAKFNQFFLFLFLIAWKVFKHNFSLLLLSIKHRGNKFQKR